MKGKCLILWFFVAMLTLSSCVTSRKVNYMQEPDKYIPHYEDTLDFEEYKLRVDDRLYVYVYSLDEKIMRMYNSGGDRNQMYGQMSGQNGMMNTRRGSSELYSYLVDKNGDIHFPTIGAIHVLGMTEREAQYAIQDKLAELLKDLPGYQTVAVEAHIVQRSFSIIGTQSGRYAINKEKLTIFEALAAAGNIHEFGDRSRIKIIREINGETTIKTFDVRSKDIINSEFYYVEPNDIIYIREIPGKSFGINSAATGLAVVSSTLSFGVFVYGLVQLGIRLSK